MPLIQFACLQLLDLLTTLVFLNCGVAEGNPLVRLVLRGSQHPAAILLALKAVACAFAFYSWRTGRTRLLGRINLLFSACVVWNAAVIVRSLR